MACQGAERRLAQLAQNSRAGRWRSDSLNDDRKPDAVSNCDGHGGAIFILTSMRAKGRVLATETNTWGDSGWDQPRVNGMRHPVGRMYPCHNISSQESVGGYFQVGLFRRHDLAALSPEQSASASAANSQPVKSAQQEGSSSCGQFGTDGFQIQIRKPVPGQVLPPGDVRILADLSRDSHFETSEVEICMEHNLQGARCELLSEMKSLPVLKDVQIGVHAVYMYLQHSCSKTVLARALPISFYVQAGSGAPNFGSSDIRDDSGSSHIPDVSLSQLAVMFDTDKGPGGHGYTDLYETVLHSFRQRHLLNQMSPKLRILEIGVKDAGSIRMWQQYFPGAEIVGVDIAMRQEWATQFPAGSGVVILQCDQANRTQLQQVVAAVSSEEEGFDVIIDDGGHTMEQQQVSLGFLFPFLRREGVFLIEDLHTSKKSYFEHHEANAEQKITTLRALHDFVENDAFATSPDTYFTSEEAAYLKKHVADVSVHQTRRRLSPSQWKDPGFVAAERELAGSLFGVLRKGLV
jgi:hypothetical protein